MPEDRPEEFLDGGIRQRPAADPDHLPQDALFARGIEDGLAQAPLDSPDGDGQLCARVQQLQQLMVQAVDLPAQTPQARGLPRRSGHRSHLSARPPALSAWPRGHNVDADDGSVASAGLATAIPPAASGAPASAGSG